MSDNSKVGPVPWFVFRCMARFFGSIFFPLFRFWGETDVRPGRLFIARNYGFLSLISALRIFRHPVRFVIIHTKPRSLWHKIALAGGLKPILITEADAEKTFETVTELLAANETVVLLIPPVPSETVLTLVHRLKSASKIMFMALTGADKALPKGAAIARVCDVSVLCGLPCVAPDECGNVLAELELLERAVKHVPLNELPSFFFNRA